MNKINSVEELDVFKLAHELTVEIYKITKEFPKEEVYGLVSQMRRAASSVPSNLAEGSNRNTSAEYKHFVGIARESAVLLGFELKELNQWNCCGATFPLTPDNVMGLTAPTKVLVNARKEGDTVTTLCSVCYNVLKRTNKVVRDDKEKRGVINNFIEEEYDGSLNVIHFLEVLRDKIGFENVKSAVKRPLKGVKAGAYYGCMLLRPFEDMGIDNTEAPTIFEN